MKVLSDLVEKKSRVYLLLVLIPALVYLKGLWYPFSPMDEQWLIVGDTDFLSDWHYLLGAFKDSIQGVYYRPVLMLSFVIDYHLGGLNPVTYHISNLIYHILATIFLYKLLLLLKTEVKTAALLSIIFSVHPVLTQAVEWIPGRNDSMLCIFSLLSFIYLVRFLTQNTLLYASLHLLFFALALLTKESAIALPLIFTVLFFIYRRFNKKFVALLLAWIALFAGWYVVRNSLITYLPASHNGFAQNLLVFIKAFLVYTGKTLFPINQSVSPTPASSSVLPGIAAIAILACLYYFFGARDKRIAFAGVCIYCVSLILPIAFSVSTPLQEQMEHRLYVSLAGLVICIGQLNFNTRSKQFNVIILIVFGLFVLKTFYRIDIFKSEWSYVKEGVEDCPDNYIFQYKKGDYLHSKRDLAGALAAYNTAIRLHPKRPELYNSRGNVYSDLGQKKETIDDYTKALELSNNPTIRLIRSMNYNKFNDPENAMADLVELQKCCRDIIPPAYEKELTEKWAELQFTRINAQIEREPNNAALYISRAKLFFSARMANETLRDLEKACALEPNNQEYKTYYRQLSSSLPH